MIRRRMSDRKSGHTFKSYVELDDDSLNSSQDDLLAENLTPYLLPGEALIAEAQHVLMFNHVNERKQGKSGVLCVTNFKLSFITTDDKTKDGVLSHTETNLGENDVCLSNVDCLYLFGDKKKKLVPTKSVTEKVKGLYVVCKNMKVLSFSFKFSPVGHGKTLVNTLLHHAFPKRHQLLFAYDYNVKSTKMPCETLSFRSSTDWVKELSRTEGRGWRLSDVNQDFKMSQSLPRWIVVPATVLDCQLTTASRHFRCERPPVWCWSSPKGAALVRMADLIPTFTDRGQENIMLELVRKSHPTLSPPVVYDLTKEMPSPKDVFQSYLKLRDLCTPEDIRQFWIQDHHFYSLLESSKWLQYVSACLSKALEAANTLCPRNSTVVLQEADGRDICCLVSSLIQILIDPYYRTITGFQTLIQKEWVIMGHPFCSRLGHVYGDESERSPLFLLFLDCVWQTIRQFPVQFQFTETYLTSLWDVAHISIYDTFLFDCERDRSVASHDPNNPVPLRNVWDEQLGFQDVSLFYNPLYRNNSSKCKTLGVRTGVSSLELWQQCYLRHIPLLEINGGGNPQIDLLCRVLLSQGQPGENGTLEGVTAGPGLDSLSQVGSFFPFSSSVQSTSSSVPLSASFIASTLSLNQSLNSSDYIYDSSFVNSSPD